VFNQLTDTLIGGTTTLTNTYTSNTERLTAGATSFLNGTLGITTQSTSGVSTNYIRDPYGNLIAMHTAGQSYHYTSNSAPATTTPPPPASPNPTPPTHAGVTPTQAMTRPTIRTRREEVAWRQV
jgi:hypothetical protein